MLPRSTSLDSLLAYLRTEDPRGTIAQLAGARDEDLADLARLTGRPLPRVYREMLRVMGSHAGGIWPRHAANEALRIYSTRLEREARGATLAPIPERYLLVGHVDESEDIFVALDVGADADDPPVVHLALASGEVHARLADSLLGMLGSNAFAAFSLVRGHVSAFLTGEQPAEGEPPQPGLDVIRAVAMREGFEPRWFSDSLNLCAQRSDVTLHVTVRDRISGHVRGSNPLSVMRIGDALAKAVSLSLGEVTSRAWFDRHAKPSSA